MHVCHTSPAVLSTGRQERSLLIFKLLALKSSFSVNSVRACTFARAEEIFDDSRVVIVRTQRRKPMSFQVFRGVSVLIKRICWSV